MSIRAVKEIKHHHITLVKLEKKIQKSHKLKLSFSTMELRMVFCKGSVRKCMCFTEAMKQYTLIGQVCVKHFVFQYLFEMDLLNI